LSGYRNSNEKEADDQLSGLKYLVRGLSTTKKYGTEIRSESGNQTLVVAMPNEKNANRHNDFTSNTLALIREEPARTALIVPVSIPTSNSSRYISLLACERNAQPAHPMPDEIMTRKTSAKGAGSETSKPGGLIESLTMPA
jgi:hypothetical protein